jgi:hypothetical protein
VRQCNAPVPYSTKPCLVKISRRPVLYVVRMLHTATRRARRQEPKIVGRRTHGSRCLKSAHRKPRPIVSKRARLARPHCHFLPLESEEPEIFSLFCRHSPKLITHGSPKLISARDGLCSMLCYEARKCHLYPEPPPKQSGDGSVLLDSRGKTSKEVSMILAIRVETVRSHRRQSVAN